MSSAPASWRETWQHFIFLSADNDSLHTVIGKERTLELPPPCSRIVDRRRGGKIFMRRQYEAWIQQSEELYEKEKGEVPNPYIVRGSPGIGVIG